MKQTKTKEQQQEERSSIFHSSLSLLSSAHLAETSDGKKQQQTALVQDGTLPRSEALLASRALQTAPLLDPSERVDCSNL
jgi:hypothetical protein